MAEAEAELRAQQVLFDQIRSWCGFASSTEWSRMAEQRGEIDRLRSLAEEMIEWLRQAGHPVKAGAFRRKLANLDDLPEPTASDSSGTRG